MAMTFVWSLATWPTSTALSKPNSAITLDRPAYAARELPEDSRGFQPRVRLSAHLRRRTAVRAADKTPAYRPAAARLTVGAPRSAPTRLAAVGELGQVAIVRVDQASNRRLEVRHGRKVNLQRRARLRSAHDVRARATVTPTDQRAPHCGRSALLAVPSPSGTPLTLHAAP